MGVMGELVDEMVREQLPVSCLSLSRHGVFLPAAKPSRSRRGESPPPPPLPEKSRIE